MKRTILRSILVLVWSAGVILGVHGQTEPDLFRSTLVQDVGTASFYELIGWLESLGLSTRGDRSALAERLYEHYSVTDDELERYAPTDPASVGENPPLVIDSASRTRYFTLEEIDERYVRLSGGVVVTLRDEEQGAVHRIEADEVTYNEDRRTLAASGAVVYTLERGSTTERFTGEALTVELDSWEGAFVQGVTERARTIEGEEIDFAFSGTYITRSIDDVIVLDDGRITSSRAVPPNYEIRASKIWVLAPGEWGLRNAYLYVGRVPVFYLPFFFKPGNELFFNPAVGTRDRSGTFIQTTTYLIGSAEAQTSAFSLLQLAEEEGEQADRRIEGLYLVPSDAPDSGESAIVSSPGSTMRLLADIYTKLGAYVALDTTISELGPLRQFEFYLGLAASRHIYTTNYPGAGAAYTPFLVTEGEAVQSWNSSQIGSLSLPFRYGVGFSARTGADRLNANLKLEMYSDPRFLSDFDERSEQIDWLGLAGQGTPTVAPGIISSLLWQIDASYRADASEFDRLSQLSLQRALVALTWRSREIDPDLLPEDVVLADSSPETSFFYPASLRLPEVAALLSGTLFSYPTAGDVDEDREPQQPQLIAPWDETEASTAGAAEPDPEDDVPLNLPTLQQPLPSPRLAAPLTANIGYSLSPTVIADQVYFDDPWEQPSDVDFDIAYGGTSIRLGGSLVYSSSLAADLLRLNGTLATNTQYRNVYDRNPEIPDGQWESLQMQAWNFTSFNTANNLTLRTQPLSASRLWSGSSLAYSLNVLLYQIVLDEVVAGEPQWRNERFEWEEDSVRQHQLQATAALALADTQSLKITAALPPRDERYTGTLSLRVAPVSLTLGTGVRRPDKWVYEPLTANATIAPIDGYSLTNTLSYSLEDEELTFNRTNLTAGPASAEFEVRTTEGYEFAGPTTGWVPDGDVKLRPTIAKFALSAEPDLEPFWRNRIVASLRSDLSWESSLIRFTESSLRFSFGTSLLVHEFLRLSLQTTSANSQTYVYFRPLAERVGREPRNLFIDFFKSLNFFDRADRVESGFNLQTIRFDALHDLGDWDLTVSYSGQPELETAADLSRSYEWRGRLALTLQWRPIKELSTSIGVDDEEITFGNDS